EVGADRRRRGGAALAGRGGGLPGVARDRHDVGARRGGALDLAEGAAHVLGLGLGHGLHRDRRGPTDDDGADPDGDGAAAVVRGHWLPWMSWMLTKITKVRMSISPA